MNVKPGINAIIIAGRNKNKLVHVESEAAEHHYMHTGYTEKAWVVTALQSVTLRGTLFGSEVKGPYYAPAGTIFVAADKELKPLYDGDEDDETLTWAGKPKELEKVRELREDA